MPSAARDDILNVSAPEKCQSLCLPEKLFEKRETMRFGPSLTRLHAVALFELKMHNTRQYGYLVWF